METILEMLSRYGVKIEMQEETSHFRIFEEKIKQPRPDLKTELSTERNLEEETLKAFNFILGEQYQSITIIDKNAFVEKNGGGEYLKMAPFWLLRTFVDFKLSEKGDGRLSLHYYNGYFKLENLVLDNLKLVRSEKFLYHLRKNRSKKNQLKIKFNATIEREILLEEISEFILGMKQDLQNGHFLEHLEKALKDHLKLVIRTALESCDTSPASGGKKW